jgi:hypothetical protein
MGICGMFSKSILKMAFKGMFIWKMLKLGPFTIGLPEKEKRI